MNVREYLNFEKEYFEINREERNYAAIFYHTLLINNNLTKFFEFLEYDKSLNLEEVSIYFEYSFLRDLWAEIKEADRDKTNKKKRDFILNFLDISNKEFLNSRSVFEFNEYFGAVPKPSHDYIQSPSNWSIKKYNENIKDNTDFLNITKFKWCFNAKPDIVLHTSKATAICIEAKYESGEGLYPSKPDEIETFNKRGLKKVAQTELQKMILEDLLGYDTKFYYLVKNKTVESTSAETITWKEIFSQFDLTNCPIFIIKWIEAIK